MAKKPPTKRRNEKWKCGLNAYSTTCGETNSLESVLEELTAEAIDAGEYCAHTIEDVVSACRQLHERLSARERLFRLCVELDMEMDGVRVPASAAAILNGIRSIVTDDE